MDTEAQSLCFEHTGSVFTGREHGQCVPDLSITNYAVFFYSESRRHYLPYRID